MTWGDGESGVSGVVSLENSLVGSKPRDKLGDLRNISSLTNGNYLVASPHWDNGTIVDAGAVTWGDGTTGVTGVVSPDNSLVASACTEGTIRIWQLATGRCLLRLAHGEGEITWLQFEHSSSALSSGGSNGKCIVWDLSRLLPEPDQVPLLQLAADRQREQAKEEAAASATAVAPSG